jgi:hypothetical protein
LTYLFFNKRLRQAQPDTEKKLALDCHPELVEGFTNRKILQSTKTTKK